MSSDPENNGSPSPRSPSSPAQASFAGVRVVVMGLGLHGGGLEAARYLAISGAEVTVTDLRDEKTLAPSIAKLEGLPLRYVLGRHEMDDFSSADMVVKNPAVRPDSPFLAAARRIETDLSIFLDACPARICAITGSKGKSGTSSAIYWVLRRAGRRAFLGGNITVSPLAFLEGLLPGDEVVLELSSWQLGDLRGRLRSDGTPLLKPRVAVITAIMSDHQDRYGSMEAYVADKRLIYAGQDQADATIVENDPWGRSFAAETRGRVLFYSASPLPPGMAGGWLEPGNACRGMALVQGTASSDRIPVELVPSRVLTPGSHQKKNLLAASLALLELGLDAQAIRTGLESYPGIEHRLEFFHEAKGVRYYNDSAATIPEAAAAAIDAFETPPILVTGGTDKALDFTPLALAAKRAKNIILLAGTGSAKLATLLDATGVDYQGPFDRLETAVRTAVAAARPGDLVVLSPGCTSFGMFLNEFDRGTKWKKAITEATAQG